MTFEQHMEVSGEAFMPYNTPQASPYSEVQYAVRWKDLDDARGLVLDAYTRLTHSKNRTGRQETHLSNIRAYILGDYIYAASRYDRRYAALRKQA